ncbi:chondroitinase-B domain-containing protein [Maribacter sp. LLG6340-A2]|uniref:chondroitinase-B domain-containing protein n=1 Tax=Maribacter sp. LLG6340-A2 TaxID=3160834 RepID=UPI003865A19F
MIKKSHFLLGAVMLLFSCAKNVDSSGIYVKDIAELNTAISNAKAGDEIIMANGEWSNVRIKLSGQGTAKQPITLKAETPGKVIVKGKSDLKLGGEYLIVNGLYFKDGFSPSQSVIEFAITEDTVANHSRITNCVIIDYNKSQRNKTDLWILFKGRRNTLEHCYIEGKSNRGPTIRVDLAGNQNINNYHKIINNYFGPRPPKGGPSAETIQLGNSFTSMAPSYTLVANNFFDRCNGEVEIISSKSNFNEFRNNVFYKSEGSLVTRHGNYCTIDGNYFIGDTDSEQIGGVRLIGTGHWVTNNYFYNLKGKIFRSPLAVMNGIPKSPLNRYIQVTDVVVAHNSFINCSSPLQFGVGSNVDQKEVLPASEIRSERPIRTIVANNLIYNNRSDQQPVVAHDSLDGITFKSNLINNQGSSFKHDTGFRQEDFSLMEIEENLLAPTQNLPVIARYKGFEFDQITEDLFGNSRTKENTIGAISKTNTVKPNPMDVSKYGPDWYQVASNTYSNTKRHTANSTEELINAVNDANAGDTIVLTANSYVLKTPLKITKLLTLKSAEATNKATINYVGEAETPAFEMNPDGELIVEGIRLIGTNNQYAFASLKNNMSSLYNVTVINSIISNFDYVLKGYKYSFSEYITFNSSTIKNCANGLELAAEDDDKGEYNAENVFIDNCLFENVTKNVVNYYRGGYDESTVGGNLKVVNTTFKNCGSKDETGILLNTYGIINVDLSKNIFKDNKINLIARLWGAKNNSHSENTFENSGKLVVEENLPLKLMY